MVHMQYAAFLRGVNVGGVTVKMAELKALLEKAGFENIKTILASGNVIFDAEKTDVDALAKKIEVVLKKRYKRDIAVMVRTIDELKKMVAYNPFSGINATTQTRMYVTFMAEDSQGVRIPEPAPGFRIVRIKDRDAFCVVELSEDYGTVDSMGQLGKMFGSRITMRSWNTVQKVVRSASSDK